MQITQAQHGKLTNNRQNVNETHLFLENFIGEAIIQEGLLSARIRYLLAKKSKLGIYFSDNT